MTQEKGQVNFVAPRFKSILKMISKIIQHATIIREKLIKLVISSTKDITD